MESQIEIILLDSLIYENCKDYLDCEQLTNAMENGTLKIVICYNNGLEYKSFGTYFNVYIQIENKIYSKIVLDNIVISKSFPILTRGDNPKKVTFGPNGYPTQEFLRTARKPTVRFNLGSQTQSLGVKSLIVLHNIIDTISMLNVPKWKNNGVGISSIKMDTDSNGDARSLSDQMIYLNLDLSYETQSSKATVYEYLNETLNIIEWNQEFYETHFLNGHVANIFVKLGSIFKNNQQSCSYTLNVDTIQLLKIGSDELNFDSQPEVDN